MDESEVARVAVTEKEVVVRVKPDRRRTGIGRVNADRRKTDRLVTDSDVARRAYELYRERGGKHGHDLDDWLQAERELRDLVHSTRSRS